MFQMLNIYLFFCVDILAQEDAYEKFFRDADVDDSGYLTVVELIEALRKGGYKGTDEQIRVGKLARLFMLRSS